MDATLYGSAVECHSEQATVWTARTVDRVCEVHSVDPAELRAELGTRESYPAAEVLVWLGY